MEVGPTWKQTRGSLGRGGGARKRKDSSVSSRVPRPSLCRLTETRRRSHLAGAGGGNRAPRKARSLPGARNPVPGRPRSGVPDPLPPRRLPAPQDGLTVSTASPPPHIHFQDPPTPAKFVPIITPNCSLKMPRPAHTLQDRLPFLF
jgi:hypothetical protein